ncbi:MAG: hypothetical protein WA734_02625 [Candidatus Acidiferrales bacterium]
MNIRIQSSRHVKGHKISGNTLLRSNARCARTAWGSLSKQSAASLSELTKTYGLSVQAGHLQFLDGRWYTTHSGLLSVAHRNHCAGIKSAIVERLCEPLASRWVFRATVYTTPRSRGFVGYGDANPHNVSPLVRGAEMRVAETRAVNRALRKAYGIGLCSVEELGSFSAPPLPNPKQAAPVYGNGNGSSHSQPRLRDQLCLLIRQFNLDPTLVKAYAVDFCGTEALKEASRDLVESFIAHISKAANEDRNALICKLNSYAPSVEVKP